MLGDGFREFVTQIWNDNYSCSRKKVKCWNRNVDGWYRKIEMEILIKLDNIDKNAEIFGLSACDRQE